MKVTAPIRSSPWPTFVTVRLLGALSVPSGWVAYSRLVALPEALPDDPPSTSTPAPLRSSWAAALPVAGADSSRAATSPARIRRGREERSVAAGLAVSKRCIWGLQ